jgi:hypothetical protein
MTQKDRNRIRRAYERLQEAREELEAIDQESLTNTEKAIHRAANNHAEGLEEVLRDYFNYREKKATGAIFRAMNHKTR